MYQTVYYHNTIQNNKLSFIANNESFNHTFNILIEHIIQAVKCDLNIHFFRLKAKNEMDTEHVWKKKEHI